MHAYVCRSVLFITCIDLYININTCICMYSLATRVYTV